MDGHSGGGFGGDHGGGHGGGFGGHHGGGHHHGGGIDSHQHGHHHNNGGHHHRGEDSRNADGYPWFTQAYDRVAGRPGGHLRWGRAGSRWSLALVPLVAVALLVLLLLH